ncbi:hypothetical protein NUQ40_10160, partial [Glaesserella parasuis]|nr:hypothetical protein [Glaesserella parasuis]
IHIIITDNGVGFDTYQILTGFGIRGMQERVNILCGTFEIISIPIEKIQFNMEQHLKLIYLTYKNNGKSKS